MKILILIDAWFPFVGGAQIHVQNLKKILEEKYDCKFIILHSPSVNIFIRFLWSFWVIPQAFFLHQRYRFDLIHAHAYWPGIPGKALSLILKIPIVFTAHGSHLMDLNKKNFSAFLEKIILTKIKYNQIISVASNFLKYKNVNKNIVIIPNGAEVKNFDKVKVGKAKSFKVLFVGRDHPFKGLSYLKTAMKKVTEEIPQAKLKIISKGVKGRELIKEFKSSHVFVLPSLVEGQPLVLLEAWAAKLAVVVTTVGENPKMVKNGVNGYLVKPKNANLLAMAILKVLKNKKRKKMGENGYNLVKKEYSWLKCAQKTYEIYEKIN